MNKKLAISSFAVLILTLSGIFLLSSCSNSSPEVEVETKVVAPPIQQTDSGSCGIESCHGLDITCGSNVPQFCNEMYKLGDRCRKFASCKNIDGECKLEESEDFDNCKSCVGECNEKSGVGDIFDCENKCYSDETEKETSNITVGDAIIGTYNIIIGEGINSGMLILNKNLTYNADTNGISGYRHWGFFNDNPRGTYKVEYRKGVNENSLINEVEHIILEIYFTSDNGNEEIFLLMNNKNSNTINFHATISEFQTTGITKPWN